MRSTKQRNSTWRRSALSGVLALAVCGCSGPSLDAPDVIGSAPPIGTLMQVNGVTVHAWEAGSGPTVILLHGASGNLRDFTFDLAPRLAASYRVIAFDRPGLGYSDGLHARGESPAEQAALLSDAARQMGVDRAIIVGHSYGGAVAMAWALNHREQAAAVVSLAGAIQPWQGGLGSWYWLTSSKIGGATIVPLVAALAPRSRAQTAIESIFTPDPVPVGYVDYIGVDLTLRAPALRANSRQVNSLITHVTAMAPRYSSLTLPIEVVHGTRDDTVPIATHSEPLILQATSARLTRLEGVGHMPHHADVAASLAAIDRAATRAGLR
jgi:pimeloyl-ACP methyl ester carboxylesterase